MEVVMHRPLTIAACVAFVTIAAQAQIPQLDIVYPKAGQDAVSPSSSMVVRAPLGIDVRSVTIRSPDAEASGWKPASPTVIVLRDSLARITDRSLWSVHAIIGRYDFDEPRILRWTPRMLLPSTKYRCVIAGVALDASAGGALCAPVEWTFTTATEVPRVDGSTLDTLSVISCGQPLSVRFSQPLPIYTLARDIIRLEAHGGNNQWIFVDADLMINQTRTAVTFMPRGRWVAGADLRLTCKMSVLTGDTYDDRSTPCKVRPASTVELNVLSVDGRTVPQEIASSISIDSTIHDGQNLICTAPIEMPDGWQFMRWECPNMPLIDGDTALRLDVTIPCELYEKKTTVRAIVAWTDTYTMIISIDSGGTVDVFDQDGGRLAHIDVKDTIKISSKTKKVTLVASASKNFAFDSWGSVLSTVNGAIAATIIVPTVMLSPPRGGKGPQKVAVPSGPQVIPKFIPQNPVRGDRFRLVANIADSDPDPMFDVNGAVTFTTPREYEDVVTGTRTICAMATRCWEIIGYHDPSSGPPVWFERGRAEHCVTAPLLDPENSIVIFARRKFIDLRLERVLLGSENPNNVLQGRQPHAETRTDVERSIRINGIDTWLPMAQLTCQQADQQYTRYTLRCGDNVRFIVRAAKKRAEEWRWWSQIPRYAIPAQVSITDDMAIYTMVIDLDIAQFEATDCVGLPKQHPEVRVQAAFRQLFGIASIGLRVRANARSKRFDSRFEERWFDPATYYDLQSDEPRDGRHLEYIPRRGTSVKIKFTMPVDGQSVLAGGINATSSDNILITDPHARGLDFTVSTGNNGNTNFLPTNGQSADIVEFLICDPLTSPIKQALHTGIIDVTCKTSLRSASGDPLAYQHTFSLRRMEVPGLGIRLQKADIAYDGDWDFIWQFYGDIYHAMYGGDLAKNEALLANQAFVRIPNCGEQPAAQGDCTDQYSDKNGPLSFGNKAVWLQTAWMAESDLAWWNMSTWDEDCKDNSNCLVNRLRDVIDAVRKRLESYGSAANGKDLNWGSIIPDLVKTGADLIRALLPIAEQDEHLGEASILLDNHTLWGMKTATAPLFEAKHENITYLLRSQWFVSRAVVR